MPETLIRILTGAKRGDMATGRGGKRPGAGRPPRAGKASTVKVTVPLTENEAADLTNALRDGETLAGLLRDGGLRLARRRT